MQTELRAMRANFNIEIIGVNRIDSASGNAIVSIGRTIPWLQDVPEQSVWNSWGVTYRDVRIVDENNEVVGVFNLTNQDLADPAHRETLKQMILQAAKAIDSDADKIPDAWELKYSRSSSVAPTFDLDLDGFNHFLEFAFGADPADVSNKPTINFSLNNAGRPTFVLKRWPGNQVDYFVETSGDLNSWHIYPTESLFVVDKNLYDGSGYYQTTFTLSQSAFDETLRFIRIRAIPQP